VPVAPAMTVPLVSSPKDLGTTSIPSTRIPTATSPAQTAFPLVTDQPYQVHRLEVPIRVGRQTYLIHRVSAGETFETIAETYSTTVGTIQALNHDLQPPLWANDSIVVAPGILSPGPALPSFETYQVMEQEVFIDTLAEKLKVNPAQLRYYNACPENCRLVAEDWLVVPRPK